MKKIGLGQTISIIANVGVIAGILLLAYELDQNRRMIQAQTRNAIAETLVNMQFQELTVPGLLDALVKAEAGLALTPAEELMIDRLSTAYWRYRENVSYQYRNGLYEEGEYLAQRETWRSFLDRYPRVRRAWCDRRERHSEAFVAEMDQLLEIPCE